MTDSEFDEANNPELDPPVWSPWPVRSRHKPLPWLHIANTQRVLAVVIVMATLLLYGYLVVAVVCRWISDEAFVRTVAALAPLQALAAATVGFFFGRRDSGSE